MGLRQIRKQPRLTQVELAKLTGLEQTQISNFERTEDPNPCWDASCGGWRGRSGRGPTNSFPLRGREPRP